MYEKVSDVKWGEWQPEITATLMFVFRDDEVLLIHKKRGLGKGKVNGPGGKLEEGETPASCAVRETEEEVGITPQNIEAVGELFFQFTNGLSIHCYVYRAAAYTGVPVETEEADPFWCRLDSLPFEKMWEDDATWFDLMLSRLFFRGRYIFDDDKMLDAVIETI
jgi:8-oxo-dGTP diphosphatase